VAVVDDYSPIYVGDTGIPFAPVFQHMDGSTFNLSGATVTMKMQDQDGNLKTCNGTWTVDDAVNGKAHYTWQSADVSTAGVWNLYITITIAGSPVHADMKQLQILSAP